MIEAIFQLYLHSADFFILYFFSYQFALDVGFLSLTPSLLIAALLKMNIEKKEKKNFISNQISININKKKY
jgi:hypothetical protein